MPECCTTFQTCCWPLETCCTPLAPYVGYIFLSLLSLIVIVLWRRAANKAANLERMIDIIQEGHRYAAQYRAHAETCDDVAPPDPFALAMADRALDRMVRMHDKSMDTILAVVDSYETIDDEDEEDDD